MLQSTSAWEPVDEAAKGWEPVAEAGGHGASGSWEPEGTLAKVARIATTPLIGEGRGEQEARAVVSAPPTLSSADHPIWTGVKAGLAGAYGDTMGTVRSMTSPLGLATLGTTRLAAVPGAVGKVAQAGETLLGAGFGAQGVGQAAQGVSDMSQQGVTPENLQQTLQGAGQGLLGTVAVGHAANKYVPSTTRAGVGRNMLQSQYAAHPVGVAGPLEAIKSITADNAKLGRPLPPEIQAYIDDLQAHGAASNSPAIKQQLLDEGTGDPATFGDADRRLTLVNQAIKGIKGFEPDAGLRTDMLKRFAGSLAKQIREDVGKPSAVAPEGFAKDYMRMVNEYRRGSQIIRAGENVGPAVGGAAGAYAGHNLGTIGAAEAAGAGAVAGKYLGKPIIGGLTRAIIERNAGAPNISRPPAPTAGPPVVTPPPAPEGSPAPAVTREVKVAAPVTPPGFKTIDQWTPEELAAKRAEAREGAPLEPFDKTEGSLGTVMKRASDQPGAASRGPVWTDAERADYHTRKPVTPVSETDAEGLTYKAFPAGYKTPVEDGGGANFDAPDLTRFKQTNGIPNALPPPSADIHIRDISPIDRGEKGGPREIYVGFHAADDFIQREALNPNGDYERGFANKLFPGKAISNARVVRQDFFSNIRGNHGLFVEFKNAGDAKSALDSLNAAQSQNALPGPGIEIVNPKTGAIDHVVDVPHRGKP